MDPLQKHPFITWFASTPVVANILMFSILAAGIFTALKVRKEGFPAFAAESVTVTVPVRGSTPEDVERGVAIKIEESLQTVNGIEHIRSVSNDSQATITVQAVEGYDVSKLLDDVKVQVDAIQAFPEQAEKPVVVENKRTNEVLWVELYGANSEAQMKETARTLRDKLLAHPDILKVEIVGSRDYEISIEPSEEKLRLYNLTFAELADAITNNSLDLGGGVIRSARGDIALRSRDQAYLREDFEEIPVRTNEDGTRIFVRDVASVRDAFVDQETVSRFRGEPSLSVQVVTEGDDDILKAVTATKEVVNDFKASLPDGMEMSYWYDGATNIRDRLKLLTKNGLAGVLLVFLILTLFLNLRLAFWVAIGVPISLAGALILFPLPGLDLSLNVISAFGFLVVLGIVVDDAIVIGESIYSEKESQRELKDSQSYIRSTVRGVSKVVTPATFGVITTIAAFLPLTQVSGRLGNVFGQIATVVIFCLIFSLIESKLILPSHLAHLNVHQTPKWKISKLWAAFQGKISSGLQWFIRKIYSPVIRTIIPWRWAVIAGFIAILIIVGSLLPAGKLRFVFFPNIYQDRITAQLELNQGQSFEYLSQSIDRIEAATITLAKRYEKEFGHNPFLETQASARDNTKGYVVTELSRSAEREFLPTQQIVNDWRKEVGSIAGARSLNYASTAGPPGGDFVINLESENLEELKEVADQLKAVVETYPGVYDVLDTFDSGKPEILYSITPEAQAAGFTKRDLAIGVRDAFFGREAQRVQRGREEVRVMVRYPIEERGSLQTLRDMRIRKPDGSAVPFSLVANTEFSDSLASIERYDNKRIVAVEGSIDKATTSPDEIQTRLDKEFFPEVLAKHPSISLSTSGEVEQRAKSMKSLQLGFLVSIIFIYVLIAIPLKSYVKPLIIMSVIPFGIIGALIGHLIMGIPVSILSVFGILALSGVVVNDSLVLVCRIDDLRKEGSTLLEACKQAGADRFRAILLTSLTTFFGLYPLLLETEVQAQFLKPMAASLAFGILFATLITLLLLPMLLLAAKDIKNIFRYTFTGKKWSELK
jgi:multidrug efflux pump subunit AcrB